MNLADALRGAMQYVDNTKQAIGRGVSDLVSNPGDVLSQWGSQVKEDLGGQSARDRLTFAMLKGGDAQGAAQNAVGDYLPLSTLGMTAYHGSPHLFDKFDMSKIGTGEGAQAYGHGLYFAENPEVAQSYKKMLSGKGGPLLRGTPSGEQTMQMSSAESMLTNMYQNRLAAGLTPEKAAEQTAKWGASHPQIGPEAAGRIVPELAPATKGALYKVDIPDEHVAKMLDWDKPLSEQSEGVRKALESAAQSLPASLKDQTLRSLSGKLSDYERDWAPVTGAALYRQIGQSLGAGQKVATQGVQDGSAAVADFLRGHGVPGIRYLDGGSRGKGGTSNFVVFDDAIPKIIDRE